MRSCCILDLTAPSRPVRRATSAIGSPLRAHFLPVPVVPTLSKTAVTPSIRNQHAGGSQLNGSKMPTMRVQTRTNRKKKGSQLKDDDGGSAGVEGSGIAAYSLLPPGHGSLFRQPSRFPVP